MGPICLVYCLWRPRALSGHGGEAFDPVQATGQGGQEAHVYAPEDEQRSGRRRSWQRGYGWCCAWCLNRLRSTRRHHLSGRSRNRCKLGIRMTYPSTKCLLSHSRRKRGTNTCPSRATVRRRHCCVTWPEPRCGEGLLKRGSDGCDCHFVFDATCVKHGAMFGDLSGKMCYHCVRRVIYIGK